MPHDNGVLRQQQGIGTRASTSDAAFGDPGGPVVVVKKLWLRQFAEELSARNLPPLKSFLDAGSTVTVRAAVSVGGPQQWPADRNDETAVAHGKGSSHPLGSCTERGGSCTEGCYSSNINEEEGGMVSMPRGELEAALLRLPPHVAARFASMGESTERSSLEASAALDPHYVQQHVGNALQVSGGECAAGEWMGGGMGANSACTTPLLSPPPTPLLCFCTTKLLSPPPTPLPLAGV